MDERAVDVGTAATPPAPPRAGGARMDRRAKVVTPAGQAWRPFSHDRLAVDSVAFLARFVLLRVRNG